MTGLDLTNSTLGEAAVHDKYTEVGKTVGFAIQTLAALYFVKACYRSRSSESRIYHYITTIVVMFCSLTYLLLALAEGSSKPYGLGDTNWLHYADWVFTTPLLLVDLGMLAHMEIPEVAFICVCDVLMIASGFGGFVTEDPMGVWPLFTFSMFMFFIILASLVTHLQALLKIHADGAENKTFVFLSAWTIGLWNVFPVIFILEKTSVMNHDQGAVVQTVLDILAKVVFGIVLMGYRELMEGHHSFLVSFTVAAVGIDPHEVDAIRARIESEERANPGSRTQGYFEHVVAMHSPKPVPARRNSAGNNNMGAVELAAMQKHIKDLEAQLAAAGANASSQSGEGSGAETRALFNTANPIFDGSTGSRRNSAAGQLVPSAPGVGRRNSGGTAASNTAGAPGQNLPRSDTAVLTQIAIAMQNDPALAGQLRSIVNDGATA